MKIETCFVKVELVKYGLMFCAYFLFYICQNFLLDVELVVHLKTGQEMLILALYGELCCIYLISLFVLRCSPQLNQIKFHSFGILFPFLALDNIYFFSCTAFEIQKTADIVKALDQHNNLERNYLNNTFF